MKLTKKLEAEILKAYNTIWDAYLKGDMRVFASMLDENCYIIGSAAGEVFSKKKAAVKYYTSTAEQITGKAELRNRKISLMVADKGFMVNEESDFYLLIDDQWTFYGPVRISSLLHKKNNKWKVIHQHGSFPDTKTEGGEQVNTEKIKAENIQLRDAVKRRTVELEQKNRELEIESSLEKVRAQALGMYKPDDLLNVCKVLFKELSLLGFSDIRNAVIHTFHDDGNYLIDYDYSDLIGGIITTIPYSDQPVIKRFLEQIRKSNEAFAEVTVKGKELNEWKKFRKSGGQPDDPRLDKTSALYYYFHSVGTADIGISAFSSVNEEQLQLLKRFRNVFDLAYKRYTDITKAEAQAREAEVELALERVRARTMAMQKPAEFNEVINVIGEQFLHLGFDIQWATFSAKGLDISNGLDIWIFAVIPGLFRSADRLFIPRAHHPIFAAFEQALRDYQTTGKDFFVMTFDKTDKNSWLDHLHDTTTYKDLPPELIAIDYDKPGYTNSIVILKDTWLSIGKHDSLPFNDEQNAILKRFSVAFGQAYTRFLDLQKAEAQAREAQIEAALERVRARSMGMQKSDELAEVVAVLYKQFEALDFGFYQVLVSIYDKKSNVIEWWSRGFGDVELPQRNIIPIIDHPFCNDLLEKWENGVDYYPHILEGEMKNNWEEYLFTKTDLKNFPQQVKDTMRSIDRVYLSDVFMKYGSLQAAGPAPLPDDKADILKRFVKVLDLAYTRMKDLQTAEMQAREAQIELGLERVRSRAMAMQTSEELNELIGTVFTELTKLDLVLTRCVILIYEGNEKGVRWWMANSEAPSMPASFFVKYTRLPFFNEFLQGWYDRSLKWQYILEGENKVRTDDFLFNETELSQLPDFVIKGMRAPDRVYLNASFNNFGNLTLASLEPLSNEHFDILLRFAKVFDLTYTRFNDLKQAEVQAKESQIQLALERVRARTMAMQRSDELPRAANLLFQQIQSLGMHAWSAGYCIWDEDKNAITLWMSSEGVIQQPLRMPLTEDPYLMHFREAHERGESFWVEDVGGKELEDHYNYLRTLPGVKESLDEIKAAGFPAPTFQIFHLAYFSKGFLLFITYEPVPESHDIFKRFGQVFEQTYTRFLDLQKAEAQAREAQIELALERVRARTMAMQRSDELMETAVVLFDQLKQLGEHIERALIGVVNEEERIVDFWATRPDGSQMDKIQKFPIDEPIVMQKVYGAWRQQKKSIVIDLQGEELRDFQFLKARSSKLKRESLGERRIENFVFFSKGFLGVINADANTPANVELYERFADVFDQTYTRFLDLQKAEAQAREAKIEAALERTRTHSMLMQHSNELDITSRVFHEQLLLLGIHSEFSYVWLPDVEKEKHLFWAAWNEEQNGSTILQSKSATYDLDRTEPYTAECFRRMGKR